MPASVTVWSAPDFTRLCQPACRSAAASINAMVRRSKGLKLLGTAECSGTARCFGREEMGNEARAGDGRPAHSTKKGMVSRNQTPQTLLLTRGASGQGESGVEGFGISQ